MLWWEYLELLRAFTKVYAIEGEKRFQKLIETEEKN